MALHVVSGSAEGPKLISTKLASHRGDIARRRSRDHNARRRFDAASTTNDGSAFPARDLAIFLAAGVIVVSLVAASFSLPFLLKGLVLPPAPSQQEEEDLARIAAAEAAIRAIEQAQHHLGEGRSDADLYTDAGVRIMELYRQRINGRSTTGKEASLARKIDEIERRLRLTGLRAERTEIYRIARARRLSDETSRKLVRELDLLESRFATR